MSRSVAIFVAMFPIAGLNSAVAEEWVDATRPERLVSVIQELGYRAKLESDNLGEPMIRSSVGGTDFSVLFFGCDQKSHDACKLLLFKVGYDLTDGTTLEVINDWNRTKLVGRAYLDDEDDPWLEMTVNLDAGVSRKNFEDTFDWWEVTVEEFESHIGY